MRLVIKTILTIALGFIVFTFAVAILATLGFVTIYILEHLLFLERIAPIIVGLCFVVVCWQLGRDTQEDIKGIKERLRKKGDK